MHLWLAHRFNKDIPTFCAHGENALPHMMQFRILSFPLLRMSNSMSHASKLMFSWCHVSLIITMMNGYCVYKIWYSKFGKHNHCWFDSCKSCFTNNSLFRERLQWLQFKQRLCHIATYTQRMIFLLLIVEIFGCVNQ